MRETAGTLKEGCFLRGDTYRIIRFISSGGFGCTYEAEHVLLEKRVAIKEFFVKDFCNRDETTSHVTVGTLSKKGLVEKLRRKFIDEAKALCRLHHPGIVSVSDVFEENGTAYYVMDYIEGSSLREMVNKEGPLSEERALRYIRQVAEALQYVHDNNRLHLDIKPGNIMIDGNDKAVLIDFGASKQYDEQDGENTSTLMGRTPGYAPPEQMSNSVVKFMPATDIYALGATLYKILTGVTPPDAFMRISGEKREPMPTNVSSATQNAVVAAMAINKNLRPQTIEDFFKLLSFRDSQHCGEDTEYTPEFLDNQNEGQHSVSRFYEMIFVAGGLFTMGATASDKDAFNDEKPSHSIILSDYYIGKYEVTQAQWVTIMGSNPSLHKGANLPVENVSWNDVQDFICKLNTMTGKAYRLPTEAEWEYAARGGNKSKGCKYSGSNDINAIAWYRDNSGGQTHPVGTKLPNEIGIYDMTGNVSEWCQDWYGCDYYKHKILHDPQGPSDGITRVLRGGNWRNEIAYCRISNRNYNRPSRRYPYYGFRLVLDIK